MNDEFVKMYIPEDWGEIRRFLTFYSTTYEFNNRQIAAAFGIEGQFSRIQLLLNLMENVMPALEEEHKELEEKGISSGFRSKTFSALIESVYIGLYSVLDCLRETLFALYSTSRGISGKSTSKLFTNALNDKIEDTVPKPIRKALAECQWFPKFQELRTTLIHFNVGSCHYDKSKNVISYFNEEIFHGGKPLVIEDVGSEIRTLFQNTNELLGKVFKEINSGLDNGKVLTNCGIYKGRIYQRWISTLDHNSFNSGRCQSKEWFDNNENFKCPLAGECGAYNK